MASPSRSHATHFFSDKGPLLPHNESGCSVCHAEGHDQCQGQPLFADDTFLDATAVCDTCHSPNGAYNGVTSSGDSVGAKENWDDGVYEADRTTLKSGKEQWCVGCHDDAPAHSQADGLGADAPNIVGDNISYGFYATGHNIDCLLCHDANKGHIDHDHRTYELDEDTGVVVNPYTDSYRLREIEGQPSMNVPRTGGGALANWQDFALCFECHNRFEVIGEDRWDVSHTNFWDEDDDPNNSHWYHLGMNNVFDSDFDGTDDSPVSCVTCHNVHGSPTGPMIRHGELISPEGTTDYVPSFNFFFLVPGDGSRTATFTPTLAGGTYDVYAWWTAGKNRSTNAKYIINHNGPQQSVVVNQEENGGTWNPLGQYDFAAGSSGSIVLTSDGVNQYIIADAIKWYRTDDGDEVIVDDPEATYEGSWNEWDGYADQYGSGARYAFAPVIDENVTVVDSIGATMQSAYLSSNHACNT